MMTMMNDDADDNNDHKLTLFKTL